MPGRSTCFCTVVGGPNGSGKSTIFAMLRPAGQFINADVVARRIRPDVPEKAYVAAGRIVLHELARATAARESFAYETTLSSNQSLALMSACKKLGYEVALVFVTLNNPDLNVRRVAERVAQGGHNIPEDVIRRRYGASFTKLAKAISRADKVLIFDNSEQEPEMLLSIEFGQVSESRLEKTSQYHAKLAMAAATGTGLDISSLFRTTPN